jgi:3-oxo-5-alpha-steroid 4-dehydrogenase 1
LQAQGICQFVSFPQHWYRHSQFLAGVLLFLVGAVINLRADATLRRLRALSSIKRTIPRGGLFEYISAPHFFGEIVEWTGFCIACNYSLPSVAFCLYTAANLIPRGVAHHAWYKTNFPNYPVNRKAVFPFLW